MQASPYRDIEIKRVHAPMLVRDQPVMFNGRVVIS
jgi:hypothetical protein